MEQNQNVNMGGGVGVISMLFAVATALILGGGYLSDNKISDLGYSVFGTLIWLMVAIGIGVSIILALFLIAWLKG